VIDSAAAIAPMMAQLSKVLLMSLAFRGLKAHHRIDRSIEHVGAQGFSNTVDCAPVLGDSAPHLSPTPAAGAQVRSYRFPFQFPFGALDALVFHAATKSGMSSCRMGSFPPQHPGVWQLAFGLIFRQRIARVFPQNGQGFSSGGAPMSSLTIQPPPFGD
jgi:hypothetical protein